MENTFLVKAEQRSQYDEDMRLIYLDEVVVTAPRIRHELRLDYYANLSADITVRSADFEQWHPTSVTNILRGIGGMEIYSDGNIILTGIGRPLVLIDGIVIDSPEELFTPFDSPVETVNPNMVESIDIIKFAGSAIFGTRGAKGAISITTKRGDTTAVKRDYDNISIFTPLGYQKPVAFYSPKYDTPQAKAYNIPDYRTTIFWKPDVVISDETEEASFEFYTSDFPTTYSVVIEGLTSDGKIIRQVEKIVVK